MVISLNFQIVSSLTITEVELNPPDSDAGFEWIEIYSEEEINLEDYFLENKDGQIFNLSNKFSGYYIINFPKQWLDNSDEFVIIKNKESEIFKTSILKDDKNNNLTWNFCNNEWKFTTSSKSEKNICETNQEPEEEIEEEEIKKDEEIPKNKSYSTEIVDSISEEKTLIKNNPIILENELPNEEPALIYSDKKRTYISIGFTLFCVIIIILLSLNRL
jgi:hypothetical protein